MGGMDCLCFTAAKSWSYFYLHPGGFPAIPGLSLGMTLGITGEAFFWAWTHFISFHFILISGMMDSKTLFWICGDSIILFWFQKLQTWWVMVFYFAYRWMQMDRFRFILIAVWDGLAWLAGVCAHSSLGECELGGLKKRNCNKIFN